MRICHCIMGRDSHCCQDTYQYLKPPFPEYPVIPLIAPDGQQIEDLEQQLKRLKKQLKRLKKKD